VRPCFSFPFAGSFMSCPAHSHSHLLPRWHLKVRLFMKRITLLLDFCWGRGMYLRCRSDHCPTLIFLWIHPLTMAMMTTTIFSCFNWLTISVLVWTSRLLKHKIMVHLYCLSPLQLFLLAMVNSNSPHLSWLFPFAISLWCALVFHFHLLVLSCHVLLTATVIFCQDGISK
jgi:hypothetical protein